MYPSPLVGTAARRGGVPARSAGLVVFVAVLVLAGAAVFTSAGSARSFFPKSWDPMVAPIAARVASLRGLDFEHPVEIRYLASKDFEKQLQTEAGPSADDVTEIHREESVFRALGFVGGKTDLLKDFQTQDASGTLAYYDPARQEIFVRGTTLDVAHRVTIAHEMTHVLQDQHFDLAKLQVAASKSDSTDGSGLKALIEGDAVRVQEAYLQELSLADRKDYDRENAAEGSRVGQETSSVSDIVAVLFGAPYEFGPPAASVLFETGGNRAVDNALTGPPPSSGVLVRTGDVSAAVPVKVPGIPAAAVRVGKPESFGPFETLLTLAVRNNSGVALSAADAVAGGEAVTYRAGNQTCYRVALEPQTAKRRRYLLNAFRAWAKGRAHSTIDAVGGVVQFTACDPGTTAPNPDPLPLQSAIELLGLRAGLTVGAASAHATAALARCLGRVFVEQPGAAELAFAVGNHAPSPRQTEQLTRFSAAAGGVCRANSDAGLR